jgi:hypothetical protein
MLSKIQISTTLPKETPFKQCIYDYRETNGQCKLTQKLDKVYNGTITISSKNNEFFGIFISPDIGIHLNNDNILTLAANNALVKATLLELKTESLITLLRGSRFDNCLYHSEQSPKDCTNIGELKYSYNGVIKISKKGSELSGFFGSPNLDTCTNDNTLRDCKIYIKLNSANISSLAKGNSEVKEILKLLNYSSSNGSGSSSNDQRPDLSPIFGLTYLIIGVIVGILGCIILPVLYNSIKNFFWLSSHGNVLSPASFTVKTDEQNHSQEASLVASVQSLCVKQQEFHEKQQEFNEQLMSEVKAIKTGQVSIQNTEKDKLTNYHGQPEYLQPSKDNLIHYSDEPLSNVQGHSVNRPAVFPQNTTDPQSRAQPTSPPTAQPPLQKPPDLSEEIIRKAVVNNEYDLIANYHHYFVSETDESRQGLEATQFKIDGDQQHALNYATSEFIAINLNSETLLIPNIVPNSTPSSDRLKRVAENKRIYIHAPGSRSFVIEQFAIVEPSGNDKYILKTLGKLG